MSRKKSHPVLPSSRMTDVASAAGVAVSTVSRALTRPGRVNAKTRDRIMEAVHSLGYTPNAMARNLRLGASRTVMVVVPDRSTSPVFTELLRGIDDAMTAEGYRLIMGRMDQAGAPGGQLLDTALSGVIDGAFVVSSDLAIDAARQLADMGIALVSLMFDLTAIGIPSVVIADRASACRAAAELIALGHRRLLYIAGTADRYHDIHRYAGVRDAVSDAGLPSSALGRIQGDYSFASGARAAEEFLRLEPRPTGVIAGDDEMAIGFIKAVSQAGLVVPRDVSVIGFDGIEFADYCQPTLSVIKQPFHDIGIGAGRIMAGLLSGEATSGKALTVHDCQMLMRDSTAAVS